MGNNIQNTQTVFSQNTDFPKWCTGKFFGVWQDSLQTIRLDILENSQHFSLLPFGKGIKKLHHRILSGKRKVIINLIFLIHINMIARIEELSLFLYLRPGGSD